MALSGLPVQNVENVLIEILEFRIRYLRRWERRHRCNGMADILNEGIQVHERPRVMDGLFRD
jgi:hypothetical protein